MKYECCQCSCRFDEPKIDTGENINDVGGHSALCPACGSLFIADIKYCVNCNTESADLDKDGYCANCNSERPDRIERWESIDSRYATLHYPDIEVVMCYHDDDVIIDAELEHDGLRIEMSTMSSVPTRKEKQDAIAKILRLKDKIQGERNE